MYTKCLWTILELHKAMVVQGLLLNQKLSISAKEPPPLSFHTSLLSLDHIILLWISSGDSKNTSI